MDSKIIDFSNCQRVHKPYGGSDRKIGILYNQKPYMIKFSENHAKRSDISTSYVNNVVSEYISSHIAESVGLPVHQTILGYYKNEIIVACQDFRGPEDENIEFGELMRATYDSKDVKRIAMLSQIYDTLADPINNLSKQLQEESIARYWDTFVIDGLVGNFDRHIGNWGYLSNNYKNTIQLAPIYDFGSTLFPNLSDEGMREMMESEYEMKKRCLVFPSPALCVTREKVGKVGYYDMMASGYDKNCSNAVKRIVPKIKTDIINNIIDKTPFITDIRKSFYKEILELRKNLILDRAYEHCVNEKYDKNALERIKLGKQYTEEMLFRDLFSNDDSEKCKRAISQKVSQELNSIINGITNQTKNPTER